MIQKSQELVFGVRGFITKCERLEYQHITQLLPKKVCKLLEIGKKQIKINKILFHQTTLHKIIN